MQISPWRLKDYVFAAFMTIGMVIAVFVVGPLAAFFPGLQLVAWAPFGGIFMTLGMARLQRKGSVALMILPLALLLLALSPVITAYLATTVLLTEAIIFFIGNYRIKRNRLLGNVIFFGSAAPLGLLLAAYGLGGKFGRLLTMPWIFVVMGIASCITGAIGWWLGELVIQQLKRAGKLDADL
ncbi:MAG: hypothetical protein QNJ63_13755 [Calothrix sp. MO_192.B10]|nr:hypothetical protein [Calothrix sp. MO_192.B10]